MKKILVFVPMIVLALSLTSCGLFKSKEEKLYDEAITILKDHLKDPDSLIVKSAEVAVDGKSYSVKILYNAKNSFGGYGDV